MLLGLLVLPSEVGFWEPLGKRLIDKGCVFVNQIFVSLSSIINRTTNGV